MFQYKILQNILPTQASLYRDGIKNSDRSTQKQSEKQTLDHLLVSHSLSLDGMKKHEKRSC